MRFYSLPPDDDERYVDVAHEDRDTSVAPESRWYDALRPTVWYDVPAEDRTFTVTGG